MNGLAEKFVDFPAYLDWPGEHATGLKAALVSPLAYRHQELWGRPDNDTLRLGRAFHTATLEPKRFLVDYVAWTRTTEGGASAQRRGREWEAFRDANPGRTILTRAQHETAVAMSDAVRAHPRAGELIREGESELSIAWTHAGTGARCKSRVDHLGRALVELKGTRDPSPKVFGATAARLHYPMQLAFYADAVRALGREVPPVKIIAVGTAPPHDVVVYSVDEELLAIGRDEYEKALNLVLACRAADSWPGLARDLELELKLPTWALPDEGWEVGVAAAEEVFFGEGGR